jgi:hypothetical protein
MVIQPVSPLAATAINKAARQRLPSSFTMRLWFSIEQKLSPIPARPESD